MKVDKELLLKHHFWILLGTFALLWLIGLCVMLFTLSDTIEGHKKDFKAKLDAANGEVKAGPKNEKTYVPPWDKHKEMFLDHKDKVWHLGWLLQKDMYTWPGAFKDKMTDPSVVLSFEERDEFKKNLYDLYVNSLRDRLKRSYDYKNGPAGVTPVDFNFDAVIKPVAFMTVGEETPLPTHEEIWLAMEDLWIKRDLVDIVRDVLDKTSKMEATEAVRPSDPDAKEKLAKAGLPEGAVARFILANATWELDLIVEKGEEQRDRRISPHSRIRNIHPGKRTLSLANPHTKAPLAFKIYQTGLAPITLSVTGEDLPYGQSEEFGKATDLVNLKLDEDFTVQQVFDWYTAPVKRIEQVVLGYQSSRTASAPLLANTEFAKADQGQPGSGPGAGPGGGAGGKPQLKPPGPAGGAAPGGGPLGGAPAAAAHDDKTKFGLERERYVQVKPECGHLPLGMVLIVDQTHVPDVMAAFANSRLRIQVTQVEMTHAANVHPQSEPPPAERPAQAPANPGGKPGPMPGGAPGLNPPARSGTAGSGAEADDPNLVELGIYGIAAIYENFEVYLKNKQKPGGAPGPATPPAGGKK
jgi:hypothetical protein